MRFIIKLLLIALVALSAGCKQTPNVEDINQVLPHHIELKFSDIKKYNFLDGDSASSKQVSFDTLNIPDSSIVYLTLLDSGKIVHQVNPQLNADSIVLPTPCCSIEHHYAGLYYSASYQFCFQLPVHNADDSISQKGFKEAATMEVMNKGQILRLGCITRHVLVPATVTCIQCDNTISCFAFYTLFGQMHVANSAQPDHRYYVSSNPSELPCGNNCCGVQDTGHQPPKK